MSKSLTISLSDTQYEAIRAAAVQAHQTPEELIAATVAERFGANGQTRPSARPAQDPLIQFMRERGHLVDPRTMPPPPTVPGMPPYGTPEWDQWVEEIAAELSEVAEAMGIDLSSSLANLVER